MHRLGVFSSEITTCYSCTSSSCTNQQTAPCQSTVAIGQTTSTMVYAGKCGSISGKESSHISQAGDSTATVIHITITIISIC